MAARRKFLTIEEALCFYENLPSGSDSETDSCDIDNDDENFTEVNNQNQCSTPNILSNDIEEANVSRSSLSPNSSYPRLPLANLQIYNNNDDDDDNYTEHDKSITDICRKWKKKKCSTNIPPFDKLSGPSDAFTSCENAVDYFLTFIDDNIRNNIIFQTNLYSVQRNRKFSPLTMKELFGFLGINLLMGYHRLPSWRHYWSNDPDLNVPYVTETMARNRFEAILSNLHLNDNTFLRDHKEDKVYKLRPIINKLNENFATLYNLPQHISIDESMILFKGRSSMKQYNPMKPIKRGYKIWCRGDMEGYISKFEIYQGRKEESSSIQKEFGLGGRVILEMTEGLKGHIVYFDNYFSSISLLEKLKMNNVFACGTINPQRKFFPKLCNEKKLNRGDFDFRRTDQGIIIYKWKDKKPVHIISNFHGTEVISVKRTQKDGTKLEIPCPLAISDYNKHMGGIDKADMLRSIYGLNRKSRKFWHRIFWGYWILQ